MAKRRKGVSLEEKRNRLLNIYHESKDVFNLKEIEKLGSKAGIVLQTIKDVNQSLQDDSLIDFDKIGAGNYFWSFPSKQTLKLQSKLKTLKEQEMELTSKLEATKRKIEDMKKNRVVSESRDLQLKRLKELRARSAELTKKELHFQENDPELLNVYSKKLKMAQDGCNRWTDNIFSMRSWIMQKQSCGGADANKWLGIPEDFDYIE